VKGLTLAPGAKQNSLPSSEVRGPLPYLAGDTVKILIGFSRADAAVIPQRERQVAAPQFGQPLRI